MSLPSRLGTRWSDQGPQLTLGATLRSLWDVADDAFFAKQNPCCPALHFEVFPRLSPALWTIIYVVASFLLFVGFILSALATWKETPHAMYCEVSPVEYLPPSFSAALTPVRLAGRHNPFCRESPLPPGAPVDIP